MSATVESSGAPSEAVGAAGPSVVVPDATDAPVYLRIEPPVAAVVLNRPDKRNALTLTMWQTLAGMVKSVAAEPEVSVVVLCSSHSAAFAAGADITEFSDRRADPRSGAVYNEAVLATEEAILECPKPVIAVVQGYCMGGGCKLALACDFRIGDDTAEFGIPVAKLGVVYPPASIQRLLDLVGPGTAKLMLLAGRRLRGQEAADAGLLDILAAGQDLAAATDALVADLVKGSPFAIGTIKRLFAAMGRQRSGGEAAILYRDLESGTYADGLYLREVQRYAERRLRGCAAEDMR